MAVLAGEFVCPACLARLRIQERGVRELQIECPECQETLVLQPTPQGTLQAERVALKPAGKSRRSPLLEASTRRSSSTPFWFWAAPLGVVLLLAGGIWAWLETSAPVAPQPLDPIAQQESPAAADDLTDPATPAPAKPVEQGPQINPQTTAATTTVSDSSDAAGTETTRTLSEFEQKLQQLGERVTNYRQTRFAFPPVYWERPNPNTPGNFSWLAGLDPQLSQDRSLLPQWNLSWEDPLNDRFVRRRREDLLNPGVSLQASTDRYPASHIVGMAGLGRDAADLPVNDPRAGIFGWNRSTRVEDVKDGLSQTLLAVGVTGKLASWADGSASIRPLTSEPYINGPDGLGTGQKNGMSVLMADGSVRFLSRETDPRLIRRMAAIADGLPLDPEIVGEPGDRPPASGKLPQVAAEVDSTAAPPAPMAVAVPGKEHEGEFEMPTTATPEDSQPSKQPQEQPPVPTTPDLTEEIQKKLEQKVLVYQLVKAAPLEAVLVEVEALIGVRIEFNASQFPPNDAARQHPVTVDRKNVTYRDLLKDILDSTHYEAQIQRDRLIIHKQKPNDSTPAINEEGENSARSVKTTKSADKQPDPAPTPET